MNSTLTQSTSNHLQSQRFPILTLSFPRIIAATVYALLKEPSPLWAAAKIR